MKKKKRLGREKLNNTEPLHLYQLSERYSKER